MSKTLKEIVDRFDIMIRADIAIGVWRRTTTELWLRTPSKVSNGGGMLGIGRKDF